MKAQNGSKLCPSCKKDLALAAFGKSKRRVDGLTVYCKECRNKKQREKYATSEQERERKRQYRIQWYAEHREEQKARVREWHKSKRQDAEYLEANRERGRRYVQSGRRAVVSKAWLTTARGRMLYNSAHRRYRRRRLARDPEFRETLRGYSLRHYRERRALGKFPQEQWEQLLEETGHKCLCCGLTEQITCDHIVPISLGGTNAISNLQPLCRSCNSSKGARNQMNYRIKDHKEGL